MNSLLKGLIMGLIGVIGAALSDMETMNIAYITLVSVLFVSQYSIKNWLMPSISDKFSVDVQDLISGILTAVFMSISIYAASLLTGVEFTWLALWKATIVAIIGYFGKTIPSKAKVIK